MAKYLYFISCRLWQTILGKTKKRGDILQKFFDLRGSYWGGGLKECRGANRAFTVGNQYVTVN